MTKPKYGIMPTQPDSMRFAKLKGDAGTYEVRAIDWISHQVNIYRSMEYEWHSIDKIAFILPEQEDES